MKQSISEIVSEAVSKNADFSPYALHAPWLGAKREGVWQARYVSKQQQVLCCFFMAWKGADIPDIPDIVDIIYDDVESYQPPNPANSLNPFNPFNPFKTPKPI